MSKTEQLWLDYARGVMTRGGGATSCCVRGDTDRFCRWPGYLGPDYATGRALFVGALHNQGETDPILPALGDVAMEWISGKISAADYLARMRTMYSIAMRTWAGGQSIFQKFADIRAALSLLPEQTATTNIAKCSTPSGNQKLYYASVNQCPLLFPLTDLIARLDPVIVFIACNDSGARISGVQSTSAHRVYRFQQRNSLEYRTGRRRDVWLTEAAAFYREAMSGRTPL